jgi:AAA domain, putative AbiEii toxin, Type IV TA system/AAA ATPase domain
LLLDFHIENFRGFKKLSLEKLGRVNLIVGKNSVGKSSVLEALRVYASGADQRVLWELVNARDENRSSRLANRSFLSLFHDGMEVQSGIRLGPKDTPLDLSLQFRGKRILSDGSVIENIDSDPTGALSDLQVQLVVRSSAGQRNVPSNGGQERTLRGLAYLADQIESEKLARTRAVHVSANGLTQQRTAELWDSVALSSLEEDVTASLRLIIPRLERVSLVGSRDEQERLPVAKLKGQDQPIPLKRLGDGVVRLFGITLALVNAQNGILLIDEIENGIHYSVQPALWNFLLEVSRRLNVQVFATSHSWDCLKAFQEASSRDTQSDGVLTRLEEFRGTIRATQFNEPELEIATTEGIEIR